MPRDSIPFVSTKIISPLSWLCVFLNGLKGGNQGSALALGRLSALYWHKTPFFSKNQEGEEGGGAAILFQCFPVSPDVPWLASLMRDA